MEEDDPNQPPTKIFCVTKVKTIKINYEWKVYNFSLLGLKNGEALTSPTFSSSNDNNFKWNLKLYPKGETAEYKEYVSLFLFLENHRKFKPIKVKFTLYVLNQSKKKSHQEVTLCYNKPIGGGFKRFIKLDLLQEYLVNDCLTIYCDILGSIDINTREITFNHSNQDSKIQEKVSNGFESILNNQELCDVTLVVLENKFYAHKAILAAHSPVFSAMFSHNMKENQLNEVVFEDVSSEVLSEVLKYIYTGKIKDMENSNEQLLQIADKYQIESLKMKCEEFLCNQLNLDNVLETIAIADHYNVPDLKKKAIKLFVFNGKSLMDKKDELNAIGNLQPQTVVEITQAFFLHQDGKH